MVLRRIIWYSIPRKSGAGLVLGTKERGAI